MFNAIRKASAMRETIPEINKYPAKNANIALQFHL